MTDTFLEDFKVKSKLLVWKRKTRSHLGDWEGILTTYSPLHDTTLLHSVSKEQVIQKAKKRMAELREVYLGAQSVEVCHETTEVMGLEL